jgi:hypothetical protein
LLPNAVSINLNADFDGGEISFPECGPRSYKAPPGRRGGLLMSPAARGVAGDAGSAVCLPAVPL